MRGTEHGLTKVISVFSRPPSLLLQRPRIQLSGPYGPVIDVHGTREPESIPSRTAVHIQRSSHPIVPPRTIVDRRAIEVNIVRAESACRLRKHSLLAHANRLIHAKPMPIPPVIIAIAVIGTILILRTIAVSIVLAIDGRAARAALIAILIVRRIS